MVQKSTILNYPEQKAVDDVLIVCSMFIGNL